MNTVRRWLADGMVRAAARRLRRRHPEWAQAILSEHASLAGDRDQLGWAFGSLRASLATVDGAYPIFLMLAALMMTVYQWSADENVVTLVVLGALSLALGLLRPQRAILSAVIVGSVVCGVNSFETLTDIRPAYEAYHHSWAHDARWLVLLLPALFSAIVGAWVGRTLLGSPERLT